eukprot:3940464-Rhodomonas_salina.2
MQCTEAGSRDGASDGEQQWATGCRAVRSVRVQYDLLGVEHVAKQGADGGGDHGNHSSWGRGSTS